MSQRPDPTRRAVLQGGTLALLLCAHQIARGASIVAVRVWPADEYTRVTIESDGELVARPLFVPDPPRLAVDIEGIELNPTLRQLVGSVLADDPFISGVRVGQFTPTVVRLVLDLKQPALPQVFTLKPVASYQHRLVLDLYPTKAIDPLEELIAQRLSDNALARGAKRRPKRRWRPTPWASSSRCKRARHRQRARPHHLPRQRLHPPPRPPRTPPTASSSLRWTPAMAVRTPARLAPTARAKKTWCCRLPTACATASTPPR